MLVISLIKFRLSLFGAICLFQIVFGTLDFEELGNIQYAIDVLDKPVLFDENVENDGVILSSKFGQLYQCRYESAEVSEKSGVDGDESSSKVVDVVDLLKPMEDEPCLIHNTGWWSYEFCFKKEIRQFHMQDGKIVGAVISLGRFVSEFNWTDSIPSRPEYAGRYHSQEYHNGTICELIGHLRSTTIKFKCHVGTADRIERIEEPSTCSYIIYVNTEKVCGHPNLKPVIQKKSVPIVCSPLLRDEEYAQYMEEQQKELSQIDDDDDDEAAAAATEEHGEEEEEREVTTKAPGVSSVEDSFVILANSVNGASHNSIKQKIVDDFVANLKKALNEDEDKEEEEEEDENSQQLIDDDDDDGLKKDKSQKISEEQENIEEDEVERKTLDKKDEMKKEKIKSSSSSLKDPTADLQEALEGLLTAVNPEFKYIVRNDLEEDVNDEMKKKEDEEEEEDEEEDGKKKDVDTLLESDVEENAIDNSEKDKENKDKTGIAANSDDDPTHEVTATDGAGTFITWQGQGNQVQQITIDTGMKVRIKQMNKSEYEKKKEEEEKEKEKDENEEIELIKTNSKPPVRKMEVRIVNAAYYNKDGKPVSVFSDEKNPTIDRMVIALLQRNDEEITEYEKQQKIEENYNFKWSKKEKKFEKKEKMDSTIENL